MIPIIDFERRSFAGQSMTSNDFDDFLMETAMELQDEYDLKWNWNQVIADDDRADRVFEAAVKFLAEVGVYNRSTSSVIKWTEQEIRDMVADYKNNPRKLTVGAGREAYTIEGRRGGDGKAPVIWAGGGPLFNADFIEPSITAFVKEPCVKGFTKAGGVAKVGDIAARADYTSEVYAQLAETDRQISTLKKVGREGMFLGNVNSPSPASGALCVRPGRYEPTQCMMGVHIAPEQKIDRNRFTAALACEDLGVTPWASAMSMVGGLAGGPGGAAMCTMANMLAQLSYSHSPWCNIAVTDMKGSSKTDMVLSCVSAVLRAAERHLGIPTGVPCCDSTVSTCHEEAIVAATLIAIVSAASSAAVNWLTGTTPLTARIQDAAMRGVAGMNADQVEPIIHNLLDDIKRIQDEHAGQTCPFDRQLFFAVYDLQSLEPKPEYKAAVERAVAMMREAGVPLESLALD